MMTKIQKNLTNEISWTKTVEGLNKEVNNGYSIIGNFINNPIKNGLYLSCAKHDNYKENEYLLFSIEKENINILKKVVSPKWATELWNSIESYFNDNSSDDEKIAEEILKVFEELTTPQNREEVANLIKEKLAIEENTFVLDNESVKESEIRTTLKVSGFDEITLEENEKIDDYINHQLNCEIKEVVNVPPSRNILADLTKNHYKYYTFFNGNMCIVTVNSSKDRINYMLLEKEMI